MDNQNKKTKVDSSCIVVNSFSQGFTLVELLVVVGVIAALAALAIPSFTLLAGKAKNSACAGSLRTVEKSILAYYVDKGTLPNHLTDLTEVSPADLVDPWGHAFVYHNLVTNPGDAIEDSMTVTMNTDFDLYSMGKNGVSAQVYDATGEDDISRSGDGGYVGLRP